MLCRNSNSRSFVDITSLFRGCNNRLDGSKTTDKHTFALNERMAYSLYHAIACERLKVVLLIT